MDAAARTRLEAETRYDPAAVEPAMFARWRETEAFAVEPDDPGEPFVVALPPPNVTGSLHMGHALNGTMQDVIVRLRRMQGRKALWICGTDHAGIATQNVVERTLARMNLTREELGREEFVRRVWQWRKESGATIIDQFQQLGCSLDYEHERFTMDEEYAKAVVVVFVEMYERGYLYRANRMVNWCPVCATAISDLEVEHVEVDDTLSFVDYALVGGGHVTVATVRPVTLLGDTAVAVNPADDRYRELIGRRAIVPLVGREVPIVGDVHVEAGVGTGALKVTPAHDPNDLEIARRHGLEEIAVIGFDGRMTEAAGERYAGLTTEEAHELVVADLRAQGALRDEQPWRHSVGHCSRSGNRVEPLVSLQWFCEMQELAAPAIAAVRDGRVRFFPKSRERIYFDWMEQIRPWCVSRQLWWGHQLPVWYCSCGETIVQVEPPTHCPSCESGALERDPDVLDTWFSSALWPFATLGWPDDTPRLRAFYPGHALFTARDIINLWVARMIMTGIAFAGDVPFQDVVIHPTVLAADGRRMSKSLGTGVDPLDLIAKHGADATRYGLLKMSSTQDVKFAEGMIEEGRGLCNKLWNAARLILLQVAPGATAAPSRAEPVDAWILARLADATSEITSALDGYDFAAAVKTLYRFVWNDVCDWYLEAAKARLYGEDAAARREISETLLYVLDATLRLSHPVLPHVTERIWEELGEPGVLARAAWPGATGLERDPEAERDVQDAFDFVVKLRQLRAVTKLAPRAPLTLRGWPRPDVAALVETLGGVAIASAAAADAAADDLLLIDALPLGDARVHVYAPGGAGELRPRYERELGNAEAEIERARRKLADARFVERAPAHLVAAEREKAERFEREAAELRARLADFGA
ncbi:MAG: valyl-tRNA synthetase [Gaiellales bacterium]|nr:valyl-tRNA synthetase [Gaiellales bacterium]